MSKLESKINLEYHNNKYTVAILKHNKYKIPLLMNRATYKILKQLNKKWYINDKNHVYCIHYNEGSKYQVYMHDIILKSSHKYNKKMHNKPIIHINNIHFDNRIENLQYDSTCKYYTKNICKKRRTINLSSHGINSNDLPTYLWYLKPDSSHGSRFMIDIPGEISWKTTSSKKVSLRYKLEEAKKYLRFLQTSRRELFDSYCMNGDLTEKGLQLYNEYRKLIRKAGYDMPVIIENTNKFLCEDTSDLTSPEIYLLYKFDPKNDTINVGSTLKEYQSMMNNY